MLTKCDCSCLKKVFLSLIFNVIFYNYVLKLIRPVIKYYCENLDVLSEDVYLRSVYECVAVRCCR